MILILALHAIIGGRPVPEYCSTRIEELEVEEIQHQEANRQRHRDLWPYVEQELLQMQSSPEEFYGEDLDSAYNDD